MAADGQVGVLDGHFYSNRGQNHAFDEASAGLSLHLHALGSPALTRYFLQHSSPGARALRGDRNCRADERCIFYLFLYSMVLVVMTYWRSPFGVWGFSNI